MKKRALKKSDVKAVWKHTKRKYHTKTINMRSRLSKLINRVPVGIAKRHLLKMGVTNVEAYLRKFYVTVRLPGQTFILVPYNIGSNKIPWGKQIEVCAHEHEHHLQILGRCAVAYGVEYFTDESARAIAEGGAEAAGADVHHALYERIPDPVHVFDNRWKKSYRTDSAHAAEAAEVYRHSVKKIKEGAFATQPGAYVVQVLRERGVIE